MGEKLSTTILYRDGKILPFVKDVATSFGKPRRGQLFDTSVDIPVLVQSSGMYS